MANYTSSHQGTWHDDQYIKSEIVNKIYPIGSIYMSVNSTSPATLFGGTWSQINNTFLVAQGSNYTAGSTGGTASHSHTTNSGTTGGHTLTVAEMPAHKHNFRTIYKDSYNIADGPVIFGRLSAQGSEAGLSAYNNYNGKEYIMTMLDTGGNGSHTHPQVSVNTNDKSNLPPYLAVYMWQRTA